MKRTALKRTQSLRRGATGRCARCGKEYQRPPSRMGKYCSPECYVAARELIGPQFERRGKTINCAACGKEFYAKPSQLQLGRKFCSRKCFYQGRDPNAGSEGRRAKMRARDRTGGRAGSQIRGFTLKAKGDRVCRVCGAEAQHAHHAVPRSLAPAGRRDLRNCLPLCSPCHARWHRGGWISRLVFTDEEWEFVSKLTTASWLDRRYPPIVI